MLHIIPLFPLPNQQFPITMAEMKQCLNLIFTLSFLFLPHLVCSAKAPAPAPSGPPDIIKILKKARQYTIFVRLLRSTQVKDRLIGELRDPDDGKTIFAPTDEAFSTMKSGSLNMLNDEQSVQLVLYHVVPTYIPLNQFQTVTNPMTTQAGDSGHGEFPLNVTTAGNTITIMTGMTTTKLAGTVYNDGQLAIYRVDQVLEPPQIFAAKSLGPAPAPETSTTRNRKGAKKSKAWRLPLHNFALFAVSVMAFALSL